MIGRFKLYRATYKRGPRMYGMTFAARSPGLAAEYAYTVVERLAKSLDKTSKIEGVRPV